MTEFEWVIALLSIFSVLLLPAIGLLISLVARWIRVEARMSEFTDDLRELVVSKDKMQGEMLQQMREDRAATDRRLRWLEENLWKFGVRSQPRASSSES